MMVASRRILLSGKRINDDDDDQPVEGGRQRENKGERNMEIGSPGEMKKKTPKNATRF